ncbi:MAG: hypothetical protein Q4D51_09325 [Eubacteriales bacterium]|nr:hypothetical protein [Eubacteriales bacterium]
MRTGFMKKVASGVLAMAMAFTMCSPVKAEAKAKVSYVMTSMRVYTCDSTDGKLKLEECFKYSVNKKGDVTKKDIIHI